ncbi:MAG: response regulator transcription factor [Bacteroidota bacterium]
MTVSIVEDNRFIRAGWEAALRAAPSFDVLGSYGSCEEALQSPTLDDSDVILMDIGLPGMSGIEGVKRIKERKPTATIVMCTVHDDDKNVFDAICAGAVGYLLKKTPPDELVKSLRDAATGGSPMTPNIARSVIASFQKPTKVVHQDDTLTDREREVLDQMVQGKSYAAIARDLFLSIDGIRYHIRHIYEKLQVHSRAEAVSFGLKSRLIQPPR